MTAEELRAEIASWRDASIHGWRGFASERSTRLTGALITALEAAETELREGDAWRERCREFIANGGCPDCFGADDDVGHRDGCRVGALEARLERLEGFHRAVAAADRECDGLGVFSTRINEALAEFARDLAFDAVAVGESDRGE